MTDPQQTRHPRRPTAIIVGVLVIVIAVVTTIGVLASGAARPGSTTQPPAAAASGSTGSDPAVTTVPSTVAPADPTKTPKPVKRTTAPTPQATKTATITESTAVPIKKELSASVVKMTAVTGVADGPGEIGGPSVRFTISIKNTTGKTFTLSNTVVNAYYGKASAPAVQLRKPGAVDFPKSVKDGDSATGVFVFNIPKADRGRVKITVDTSVQNPVIAFQGAAPKS